MKCEGVRWPWVDDKIGRRTAAWARVRDTWLSVPEM